MTDRFPPRPAGTAIPCLVLALSAWLGAQRAPATEGITEARVREVVTFLASDDLRGRDTPSKGLEEAADYLQERFEKAGLEQLVPGSWSHRYRLPGMRLSSTTIALRVQRLEGEAVEERALVADADVRLLRPGRLEGEAWQQVTAVDFVDPRAQRLLTMGGGRRPVIVAIDPESPVWQNSQGEREVLGSMRGGARPVLLVRQDALPPGEVGAGTYSIAGSLPEPEAVEVELRNVVAVLPGKELPEEYVLVTAHYDHVGMGAAVAGDGIYNGADDDATGTTAVVILAEALVRGPRPRRSIVFACFSAEEKGLRGSRAFSEAPPLALDRVVANVNIEMIGRPEEGKQRQAWITGAEYSDFAAIAGPALERAGIELTEFGMARMLFGASDNFSLAAKGVVAHSISAGSLHRDYHQPSDEVSKLDLVHMTAVIGGLREAVLEFANRPARPAWNEAGRKALDEMLRRRR